MSLDTARTNAATDRQADLRSLWLIAALVLLSCLVQAITRQIEIERIGLPISWRETWLLEGSSHIAILGLVPLLPWVLTRAPLSEDGWLRSAPLHVAGAAVFSLLHIALMLALRKLAFPAVVGAPYSVALFAPRHLGYEFSKDIFTYALLTFGFVANRMICGRHAEAVRKAHEVRETGILSLRSGASTFRIRASDVRWAKAAGNYVEVVTGTRSYLVRQTLAALERDLGQAGKAHIRVHRSYLVQRDQVAAVQPTGEGGVTITLADGTQIPGSRHYRKALDGIL